MHGVGIFQWKDGKQYIGEYKYDKKEGYGRYIWNKDQYFEGFWKDGKQYGNGLLVHKEKFEYSQYKQGKAVKELTAEEIDEFKKNEHIENDLINTIYNKFKAFEAKPKKYNKDNYIIMTPIESTKTMLTVPNDIKVQYQSKSLKSGLGERPSSRTGTQNN